MPCEQKWCYKCKTFKDLSEFYKNRCQKDGLDNRCKKCDKAGKDKRTKRWQEKNKKHISEYGKKYRIENSEKIRQRRKNRRLKLRFKILQLYNFTCKYCGRKAPDVVLEVDHIHPRSKGGKDNVDNYVVACRECNMGKGDSILKEFK